MNRESSYPKRQKNKKLTEIFFKVSGGKNSCWVDDGRYVLPGGAKTWKVLISETTICANEQGSCRPNICDISIPIYCYVNANNKHIMNIKGYEAIKKSQCCLEK